SGSQFALLPPDNATGNFTKVVQRVPVKIALDDSTLTPRLRSGLSAVVTIRTNAEESCRGNHVERFHRRAGPGYEVRGSVGPRVLAAGRPLPHPAARHPRG